MERNFFCCFEWRRLSRSWQSNEIEKSLVYDVHFVYPTQKKSSHAKKKKTNKKKRFLYIWCIRRLMIMNWDLNKGRSKIEFEFKKKMFYRLPSLNVMTQRRFEMLKSHCRNSSKMLNQFQNTLQYGGHFCTLYQNFFLTVITRCIFLAGSIFLSWNGIQEIWCCLKWGKRKRKLQRKREILKAICVKGKDFFRFFFVWPWLLSRSS